MADDNVTDMPDNKGKGVKTAAQIMAEIKQQANNAKASEFKNKAAEKMKEIEKLRSSLSLAEKELENMVNEYHASIQG